MKQEIISAFLPQLIGILFAVLCAVGTRALHELRRRFKNEAFTSLLLQLEKLSAIVVAEVEQTVVEPAKKAAADGKLTPETASIVREQAIRRLHALLGDKNSELAKVFKDSEAALVSMIESKVLDLRRRSMSAQGKVDEKP
jgi:hypothetical protein